MDCFSNLPDEVLCHILSFLTTKEAALTSILAKRWRDLLAFVPSLTIDNSIFLHPEKNKQDREDIKKNFMDFVDRVLALQGNSPLNKFSLECFTAVNTERVDGWISNVLARGVSDLDLSIFLDCDEDDNYYELSPKFFECSTLVRLKIYNDIGISLVPGRVFLPLLKTMVLDSVYLCPNEFETLLLALPSLEELVLVNATWKDNDVTVSSASLKTLTISLDDCYNTLSFDTPGLLHFKYICYAAFEDYPVVNMGNLVDAKIIFIFVNYWSDLTNSKVWKLVHGIRNVLNLDLYSYTLELLSKCSETMPVFNNLKSLAIWSSKDRGWEAMPALLRNCPHLETLVIKGLVHYVTNKCGDVCNCISREDKGLSLKLCPVKVMKIHGFLCTMKEMAMIEHFLDYFPCLKEMEVYAEENNTRQPRTHEVSKVFLKIFELNNKLSSCNVKLLVGDYLSGSRTKPSSSFCQIRLEQS